MLEYELMQNESTASCSTQYCYQDQLIYVDIAALDYFAKCWCWAVAGDAGGCAVFLKVYSIHAFLWIQTPSLVSCLLICSFLSDINYWSVSQGWLKGTAGTIIFLICFEEKLILIVYNYKMPTRKEHFVLKNEDINIQVFIMATNFESGEHLA